MKSTDIMIAAGLVAMGMSASSQAVAQNYFARVKVREIGTAPTANPAPTGAWRFVVERIYDCRQKGAWLESQYLPACVVSNAIVPDGQCSTTKPAPIGDTSIADPAAAGCPILSERNLI
jgi:hypothetical protein